MKIEQLEQTKVKANLCSVEYQPRRVPGKEILEQEVYGIDPYTHNLPKEIVPADLDWSIDDKAEEKQGVNESGDEDTINKDIAVKTNFVMANVPNEAKFYLTQLYMVGRDDKWLWSTGLLWKPPPWPDFCAMSCVSVAQHGGYEVLVNFHPVNRYHISLDKAFEFNDYCRSHQPPISLIKAEVCGLFGSVFCDFGPEITVLDIDGEDPHTGITDNPALVSCDDDEADFHMKQDAFLYNLGAQMLPKSYHCFSRRLMLEYSKFSSLDSDEPFACKLNNRKHRDTYKQVNVHVLNYEAILWEKLPKFSMQQLYFVGLLWNLPPWPDLNFCEVNWMANGMEKGAGIAAMKDTYNAVTGQSKIYSQQAKSKPFIEAGVKNETVSAPSGTPSTDLIASGNNTPQRCFSPMKSGTGTFENQNNSPGDATPPPGFCCPISMKLMSDPVIIASGHTYEREKLSQFCHVTVANIFSLYDVSNIGHDEESFEFKTDEEEVIDGPERVVRVWDPGTGLENMKWQSSPLGVVGGLTFGAVSAAGRDQPEDLALKVESALYSVGVAESFCTGQIDKLSFWSQGISQDSPVGTDEFMSLKKPTRLVLRVRKPRAVVNITPAVSSALLMNELQWIGLIVKPIDYSLKDGILHIDASAGLKIEEISTKLREYCPSCFNVSDYKYYLIVENLERASMTNNHDGREILARDAFSLLTRIPESADLSAICKRFEKRRFYEAVIQLILQKAQTLDSIADVINGQINVRPHDTTIAQCELCYQIVMNALSTLKGVGQRGTQRADQSSSSASALDSISRSKYSNQLIPLSVHWPDTALHDHLYITLIEFLEYGGFDLVAFLQSAGHKHQEEVREVSVVASKGSKLHDLCASLSTIQTKYMELLVRYDVLKGEYIVAARSLLIWADVQCSNAKEAPTLDQRYQYLSNAVLQAKSTDIATEFSKNPIDSNITVYPLEGKIAVLQFQTQIKQELEYMAFWLEHIPGSYELLSDPFPRDNIVADAETAMTATDKAIKHVFPSTQHCFSYWHILKNAQPHIGTVYTFQAYQNMCMKCMQGSDSEMELEESWTAMLHEHKPHDNNWLNDLSRFHHRWCSVFNTDTFETGINSSQWGKVPNYILTGIEDESTFLILFSLLLEKVVRVLLRNEFEDFLCNQTAPVRAIKHSTILSRLYILEDKYVFEGEVMSELLTIED